MKFTLAQIAAAAASGGLDVDDVMHDLLQLAERNGGTPTLREYFVAHAPEHPQPWFRPVMPHPRPTAAPRPADWSKREHDDFRAWLDDAIETEQIESPRVAFFARQKMHDDKQAEDWNEDFAKQRFIQWPSAWADEQLKLLAARLIG